MWYTNFFRWEKRDGEKPKHYYAIKYAHSTDGLTWKRTDTICIDFEHAGEHVICHPTVIKQNGRYHMWYCYRGERYKIGYATSKDALHWERKDGLAGIGCSNAGWNFEEVCYPRVFQHKDLLYMLYCGNNYGKTGLGLATMPIADLG